MRKSNFKALLLSLLSRRMRRWADSLAEPEDESAETVAARSAGKVSPAPSAGESAGESPAASRIATASQEAELDQADQSLPDQPAGPPEDWLRRKSAGPPAHWVERVRQAAPELLRQEGEGEFVLTARASEPAEPQPPPPPLRLERPVSTTQPPPLRLERPASTPPRQAQPDGSDEPLSSSARIPGESGSESTGRTLSSDVPRGPIAETRFQVERPRRHHPQAARQEPSLASSPGVQESPAGGETVWASRRDADSISQTTGFASRAGEDAGMRGREGAAAQDEQSAEDPHTVAGKPVEFQSDWAGGKPAVRQTLRIEEPKPLMKPVEAEERESRPQAETPSRQGAEATKPSPVAPLRREAVYPEIARPGARKFQIRVEPGSDSGDDWRTRTRPLAATSSTMPIEPAKAGERHFASETVSSDRWPELPEAADYPDEMAVAWLELRRRQRLAHEQTGSIWSE